MPISRKPVTKAKSRNQQAGPRGNGQTSTLPFMPSADERLDVSTLETWLWDAACAIRGATDAPKFKDFILPLVFYKRLSDVYTDELAAYVGQFGGDEELARELIATDHADALRSGRPPIVRFYIPDDYAWPRVRNHPADGTLGQFISDALREVARFNPKLDGVLNVKDFNERQSGQRALDDDRLAALIEVVNRHRLGLTNTEPDILGRAYEYLLRKFAEGQGQSAGEFYTPKEVGWLMAVVLNPRARATACGSAGLLIKLRLLFEQVHRVPRLEMDFAVEFMVASRKNPQQGALPRAIQTEHADLGAVIERQVDVTEDLFPLDRLRHGDHGENDLGLFRFWHAWAKP